MIVSREVCNRTSTTLAVGASLSSVLSGYGNKAGLAVDVGLDLKSFDTKTFFLKNVGPNVLNGVLQATNIPAEQRQANDWETIDATTFQAMAAGTAKSRVFAGDGRRYWRMQATSVLAAAIANCTAR